MAQDIHRDIDIFAAGMLNLLHLALRDRDLLNLGSSLGQRQSGLICLPFLFVLVVLELLVLLFFFLLLLFFLELLVLFAFVQFLVLIQLFVIGGAQQSIAPLRSDHTAAA